MDDQSLGNLSLGGSIFRIWESAASSDSLGIF